MARSDFDNYYDKRKSDAEDFVNQYWDDLIIQLKDGNRVDFYSFVDDDCNYHEWLDQYISPREALDILDNADEEETDSGLWEGLSPLEAISSMGFWTYKLDLYQEIRSQFKDRLEEVMEKEEEALKDYSASLDRMNTNLELLQSSLEDAENDDQDQDKIDSLQNQIEKLEQDIEEWDEKHTDQQYLVDGMENLIDDL